MTEMRRLDGIQFNPEIVDAFNQLDPDQLAGTEPTTPGSRHACAPSADQSPREPLERVLGSVRLG